ncbi:MAG: glutamyl-tRNA amidotransferase [Firmicutes bacterium ML8_F2]|jgi:aspartyl-tRNA(Asn)/glutamyl-tRNA(Gln) amidotransferase subunit B|nr:MAG: glutamyl-tRNA amidotransferase [Firmicutes bacterium ML8_F2]
MDYEVVIGLEVHVELKTESKLFCSCPNCFVPEPNVNICPVCLGFPGTLPRLNREAVKLALTASLALNCRIALRSWFDRKNYFYPDIPKGYQISQYYEPIGSRGSLTIDDDQGQAKVVRIGRVHMEEDAGKLIHSPAGDASLVDYNRAGVPLVEIVTEPDLRTPGEARCYLEKLKIILQYAGVSDCKMEEGSLRCDANISLRPAGSKNLGSKTELKNMNSFKAVEKSLEHEIKRQRSILKSGRAVISQTLRWEEDRQETIVMRGKLEAHDYRCFADCDLAPIELTAGEVEEARAALPEMAEARAERFVRDYKLPDYDAAVLTASRGLADYFESCLESYGNPKNISNWIMGELSARLNSAGIEIDSCLFGPEHMTELLRMIDEKLISGKIAKDVLEKAFISGKMPRSIVEEEGLLQISNQSELEGIIEKVLKENPDSVENYRRGKTKAIGFLVGQVMKETRGKANPKLVNELLVEKIDSR